MKRMNDKRIYGRQLCSLTTFIFTLHAVNERPSETLRNGGSLRREEEEENRMRLAFAPESLLQDMTV